LCKELHLKLKEVYLKAYPKTCFFNSRVGGMLNSVHHNSNVKPVYYRTFSFPITPFFNAKPVRSSFQCAKLEYSHASCPNRISSSFETVTCDFRSPGGLYFPSVSIPAFSLSLQRDQSHQHLQIINLKQFRGSS